jgi:hypothetical protein
MMQNLSPQERIRRNAAAVVERMAQQGRTLTYDEAGGAWLDGSINRNWEAFAPENTKRLINLFGSSFGACIRQRYGGEWSALHGTWAFAFDSLNAVFPFDKVAKHFANGAEDAMLRLFTAIPIAFYLDERD